MELRKHPLMTYRGGNNWPPPWAWISGKKNKLVPSGEVGTLVEVTQSKLDPHGKCFVTIEYDGAYYIGCLLFDDGAFCQQVARLLQRHLRYPLEYIAGIELSYGRENEPPSASFPPDRLSKSPEQTARRSSPGQHKRPYRDSQ
jgi:hypothetical protein